MLIDSEELKKRLKTQAGMDEDQAFDFAVTMVEELEVETEESYKKTCGDRFKYGGKIFSCRIKGPHSIHDDFEWTDGKPMRWMDTSLGRLKPVDA